MHMTAADRLDTYVSCTSTLPALVRVILAFSHRSTSCSLVVTNLPLAVSIDLNLPELLGKRPSPGRTQQAMLAPNRDRAVLLQLMPALPVWIVMELPAEIATLRVMVR